MSITLGILVSIFEDISAIRRDFSSFDDTLPFIGLGESPTNTVAMSSLFTDMVNENCLSLYVTVRGSIILLLIASSTMFAICVFLCNVIFSGCFFVSFFAIFVLLLFYLISSQYYHICLQSATGYCIICYGI